METMTETREDIAREIAARLEVRRRFYLAGFFVFSVAVVLSFVVASWVAGPMPSEAMAGAAFPILGTGVVLWWLYVARRAELYEEVGRRFFGEK